ncbi:MAG: hypothetical protein ACREKM_00890 [Longimicrobiales bacterium]
MKSLLRRTFTIALAIGAAACGRNDAERFGGEVRRGLDEGAAAAAIWLEQESYAIDPAAFDRLSRLRGGPGSGGAHLRLITDAIAESRDSRTGELAVRLAYALATAEGALAPTAPKIAAQAAAMVRDRMLAAEDARRLLRASDSSGVQAFSLLRRWRQDRLFQVEQPTLATASAEREQEAMTLGPRLAGALRDLPLRPQERAHEPVPASLLGDAAAERLLAIVDSMETPPQAPVAIAARMYRKELLDQPWVSRAQRDARVRFIANATGEEAFAAELALLEPAGAHDVAPAMSALAAAVGLRTYAQEQVWFPGFGGPSTRELAERYGLAAITFDDALPATWRPYLRRMIDLAFADLRLVMPALDVRGLRVHFGSGPEHLATLAMHDPATRRLLLPPATSAGTIAHEIAHDLDWQVALRRYRVRGDYASDRATRTRGDRLAMHLRDLTHGLLEAPRPGESAVHATRPAEVFARNIDWFVAVALAAQGRSNGYLSSVQDDILTGYGTVRPPDVTGGAGDALMTILDEVAPVYPRTRQWFLRSYGTARSLTPYDLVRHVLEVGDGDGATDDQALTPLRIEAASAGAVRIETVASARDDALSAIDRWVCRAPAASHDRELELARRRLVTEAAAARGRGLALVQARQLAGERGVSWLRREFYGAPWPLVHLDEATLELLAPLADAARGLSQSHEAPPTELFNLARVAVGCADAPFALVVDS